jgi:hypothetical protein
MALGLQPRGQRFVGHEKTHKPAPAQNLSHVGSMNGIESGVQNLFWTSRSQCHIVPTNRSSLLKHRRLMPQRDYELVMGIDLPAGLIFRRHPTLAKGLP